MKSLYKSFLICCLSYPLLCHGSIQKSRDIRSNQVKPIPAYLTLVQKSTHALQTKNKQALHEAATLARSVTLSPKDSLEILAQKISSLSLFYRASLSQNTLTKIIKGATLGFSKHPHSSTDYLALAQLGFTVYGITGQRAWLGRAVSASRKAVVLPSDSYSLKTFAHTIWHQSYHYTGLELFKQKAEKLKKIQPSVIQKNLQPQPLHVTIVGAKEDEAAQALYQMALSYPVVSYILSWWDPSEGPHIHKKQKYPKLKKAAVFVCTDRLCSLPLFDPNTLHKRIDQIVNQKI